MAVTITLANTGRKLFTLYPDGTDLVQLQDPGEFTKNAIGERKRIELSFSSSESVLLHQIYFDPALFLPAGTPSMAPNTPTQAWVYFVNYGITPGEYDMSLILPAPYNAGLIKNWSCKFVYINATSFKIYFEFFQLYDLNGYLNAASESNYLKLVSKTLIDPSSLISPPLNVYTNSNVKPQFYVFIENIATGDTGFLNVLFTDYSASYYNKNALDAAPYFTLPVWGLELNGSPVTTLQLSGDTKVTFGITAPGVVDKIFIWLIKTSSNNNATDFITNYDASYLNMTNVGGSATLSNKIKAPTTEPTLVSGKYEVEFNIDKTTLLFGEKYKIIAVVYESGYGGVDVNSFISEEYSVDELPRFTGVNYEFTGKMQDYEDTYYGNDLVAVVEERMISKLSVGYDYNVFSDDMINRLGLTVANDIKRYLTKVTVEVYSIDVLPLFNITNFYDRLVAVKTDPINYSVPSGLVLDFNTGELEISYSFRNRYESWLPNLETFQGASQIIPPTANQNWAGRDLFIKYSLELFYDDYSTPFSDTIIFEQKLHPKDYGSEVTIVQLPDIPVEENTYFCSDEEYVCLEAKLNVPNPENYYLITTFEPVPGNSPTLDENEEWVGSNSDLPQLQSVKILSSQTSFSETISGAAYFCVIPTKFFINLPYKVSAIAKLKEACVRITEDDFLRLEEDNEIRIMENC